MADIQLHMSKEEAKALRALLEFGSPAGGPLAAILLDLRSLLDDHHVLLSHTSWRIKGNKYIKSEVLNTLKGDLNLADTEAMRLLEDLGGPVGAMLPGVLARKLKRTYPSAVTILT
jgi:hypothetical protein